MPPPDVTYTPVDYTPDFSDEQKASAISIRPTNPALRNPAGNLGEPQDAGPTNTAPAAPNRPTILDSLFGLNGTQRYQLWPERLVRAALEAPQKALRGELEPQPTEQDPTGRMKEIEAAQDMANLVGSGAPSALAGGMSLGAAGGKMIQPSTAPVFYSAVEHALKNAGQQKATGEQWLGYLMNSPGIKSEELEWTGLADMLAGNNTQVTKQELAQHLANNKVEVIPQKPAGGEDEDAYLEEASRVADGLVNKWLSKEPDIKIKKVEDTYYLYNDGDFIGLEYNKANADSMKHDFIDSYRRRDPDRLMEWAMDVAVDHPDFNLAGNGGIAGQRYSRYQLPGGENYSEMVLTLPTGPKKVESGDFSSYTKPSKEKYQSSHWDEPNILAHVRFNDRMINGKKTLFLEEVQSDWHQAGRKKGYKGSRNPDDYSAKHFSKRKGWQIYDKEGKEVGVVPDTDVGVGRSVGSNEKDVVDYFLNLESVPDAPFKKTWPELVMKQMLRKAAEEGYEQVAWTPGAVQNKRYSGRGKNEEAGMSKFYDEILPDVANKLGKKFGAKVEQLPLDAGGNLVNTHVLPLTPELASTALGKGFPLFSSGLPFMFTPVDHNPFEEEKENATQKR